MTLTSYPTWDCTLHFLNQSILQSILVHHLDQHAVSVFRMYPDKLQLRVAAVLEEIVAMQLHTLFFKLSKGILKMARGKSNLVKALSMVSQSLRGSRIGVYRL